MDETAYFPGRTESLVRTVTAAEVEAFAKATGDVNPVHLDEAYAQGTRFGHRIAHGMLAASYISALLGTQFPGPGTIYVSQALNFLKPVYLGDTLRVSVTVTKFRADKAILTLETAIQNQRGDKVLAGEAVCLVGDVASQPRRAVSGAAAD
ncbi:MAG: MaoC family dehydratase [Candidatus Eremiobacteraeota bacterium]|nr:MaoC family dehydratase [Candidatus Eremiobacteraeota bacterium]